jgi:hypothetical protein
MNRSLKPMRALRALVGAPIVCGPEAASAQHADPRLPQGGRGHIGQRAHAR